MSEPATAVRARAQSAWQELDAQPLEPVELPRARMPEGGAAGPAPAPTPQGGADNARDFLLIGAATATLSEGLKVPSVSAKPPVTDIRQLSGPRLDSHLQARIKMVGPAITPPVGLKHNAREARLRSLQADLNKLSVEQRQGISPDVRQALERLGLRC